MDIVDYQIFLNLLVNHIKNGFVEYRQFCLIFTLIRTAFFLILFERYEKYYFFVQQYIRED